VVVDEPITPAMLLGAGMIITALAVHQGLWRQRSPMNTVMDTRS